MISVLFLMGTQSAFFGPVKYAILPQHLDDTELTGGNGMVELVPFWRSSWHNRGTQLISRANDDSVLPVAVVLLALLSGVPGATLHTISAAGDKNIVVSFNPVSQTIKLVRATAVIGIFQSILGNFLFWFMGANYLAQFPVYAVMCWVAVLMYLPYCWRHSLLASHWDRYYANVFRRPRRDWSGAIRGHRSDALRF